MVINSNSKSRHNIAWTSSFHQIISSKNCSKPQNVLVGYLRPPLVASLQKVRLEKPLRMRILLRGIQI